MTQKIMIILFIAFKKRQEANSRFTSQSKQQVNHKQQDQHKNDKLSGKRHSND